MEVPLLRGTSMEFMLYVKELHMVSKTKTVIIAAFNQGKVLLKNHEKNYILTDASRVSEWLVEIDRINAAGGLDGSLHIDGELVKHCRITKLKAIVEKGSVVKDYNPFIIEAVIEEDLAEGDKSIQDHVMLSDIPDVSFEFVGGRTFIAHGNNRYRAKYSGIEGAQFTIIHSRNIKTAPSTRPGKNVRPAIENHDLRKDTTYIQRTRAFSRYYELQAFVDREFPDPADMAEYKGLYELFRSDSTQLAFYREMKSFLLGLTGRVYDYDRKGLHFKIAVDEIRPTDRVSFKPSGRNDPFLSVISFITVGYFNGQCPDILDMRVRVYDIKGNKKGTVLEGMKTTFTYTERARITNHICRMIMSTATTRFNREILASLKTNLSVKGMDALMHDVKFECNRLMSAAKLKEETTTCI